MLDNLIFSIQNTLPLFLVMATGAILKRKNVIDNTFVDQVSTYLYYIGLPLKLFQSVAGSNIREVADMRFVLSAAASIVVGFLLAWGFARLTIRDQSQVGTFVHGAFRGNFVYIGLALAESIIGKSADSVGAQVLVVLVPLYNICAVLVLTATGDQKKKTAPWEFLKKFITNPMLVAVLAAIPFSIWQIPIVKTVSTTMNYLGGVSTGMALLIIGASMSVQVLHTKKRELLLACLYKLILQPLLLLPFFIWVLHCTAPQIVVAFVMLGAPSASNVYVMTKKIGGDAELGAGILVVSEVLAVGSMTLWIFALRTLGVI